MRIAELKWEVRKRLEEIERCLYWKGAVGRPDLVEAFGISSTQASADLSLYQELAPGNTLFNGSLKRYEPTEGFAPLIIRCDINDYIRWAGEKSPFVDHTPSPLRPVDQAILRKVVNAIHGNNSIQIAYQSMSSSKPSKRRLTPHTLVSDGYRYHVRGYCHKREEFRDFVLGRIMEATSPDKPGKDRSDDEAWHNWVILRLRPHEGLTKDQSRVIERDYGMEGGELRLRVRQAMLVYTKVQLRLDRFMEERTPAEQQIVIANPEVLDMG